MVFDLVVKLWNRSEMARRVESLYRPRVLTDCPAGILLVESLK